MLRYCLAGMLACMPMMASAVIEDFSSALWQHHEELGTQVLTDDLVISVPADRSVTGRAPTKMLASEARCTFAGTSELMKISVS